HSRTAACRIRGCAGTPSPPHRPRARSGRTPFRVRDTTASSPPWTPAAARQDLVLDPEQAHRAHGAAEQAAEDVAAAFVAGPDTVADDDQRRADVVGDDAHLHIGVLVGTVGAPGQSAGGLDDGEHLV